MEIPNQLRRKEFRFIKIKPGTKIPYEPEWQTKNNYTHEEADKLGEQSYGVVTGYGNLIVVDFDDAKLQEELLPKLRETFTVKSGGRGLYHLYYISDKEPKSRGFKGADLKGIGGQVIGAGSKIRREDGSIGEYEVVTDIGISSVPYDDLISLFTPEKKEEVKQEQKDTSRSGVEFGLVCGYIKEGFTKEDVFEKMKDSSKWKTAGSAYQEHTYQKGVEAVKTEQKQASGFLTRKELFENLDKELDKKIVYENDTRRTILLVALGGKLVINAYPTSSNLMVNDDSGAGKDYIVKSVLDILPKQDVICRKRISETAFTYWNSKNKDWTWDGKVFYNEDIGNALLNSDVFKVMSSSTGINRSTIVINNEAKDIITKGKPVMVITIAVAQPKAELLRRYPICNLNTTEEQTKLIVRRKAKYHQDGIIPSYNPDILRDLSHLKRVKVKIPFADKLETALNTKHIIVRTHFDRFMDYIKFSTAIHQYQRKEEEGFYLAEGQDYEIAREAIIKTSSNAFCIPLTRNQQKILELMADREKVGILPKSVSDLEPFITFISDRQLRRELDKLSLYGFLLKDKEARSDSKKMVMIYSLNKIEGIDVPTWQQINNKSVKSDSLDI